MSVQVQFRRDTTQNVQANKGAVGEVFVDTTVNRLTVQDNNKLGGWPTPITLSVQNGGNTNNSNSGSGADFDHDKTFSIPANFMIAARAFRVTAHFRMTTGSAAPANLIHKLKLGSTVIGSSAALGLGASANLTNVQFGVQWVFQSIQALGAAANVECMGQCAPNGVGPTGVTVTAMPVAIDTTAAQTVKLTTRWSDAGTGTNTIGLNQLIVEALN